LEVAKRSGGSTTSLASVSFTATATTFYWMRLDVATGASATEQARIWADGSPEPQGWMVRATDSSPLAANLVGTGGSWDLAGAGESIQYVCYAYAASGLAAPCSTPTATQTVIPTATATATATPSPTQTKTSNATPTLTTTATPSGSPTSTPTWTATPRPT